MGVRASLTRAAADAGVPPERFRPVGPHRWREPFDTFLVRFTKRGRANADRRWLWEDLPDGAIAVDTRGAGRALLAHLVPDHAPAWFVAEDVSGTKQGSPFWLFETDTAAIVEVLAAHAPFEFYVVDRRWSWMVGENHHDVLFAVGEPAASRLAELRARGIGSGTG